MGCQPREAGNQTRPVCAVAWDRGGWTTDSGSPHHEIKKSSPRLREIQGVLTGAVAQQIKFTGVTGRVGQASPTPFPTYQWFTSPPDLMGKHSAATRRVPQPYALAFFPP